MSLFQDPEPFEFTILDELISNLTASDEESLGMCEYLCSLPVSASLTNGCLTDRDGDTDSDYWTADDEPVTPPRLRTASLRGPSGIFSYLSLLHNLTVDHYDRNT